MKVIKPNTITDALFTSSNVAETDYAVWSGATTYAVGNRVIVTTSGDHHCYESLQAANTNHNPKTSPTWWLDLGADNRWAMFDGVVGTQTSNADSIAVVLVPGGINSLALLNIDATTVDISLIDGATTVYSQSINLSADSVYDLYSYFFSPIIRKTSFAIVDMPVYATGSLHVTINNPGSTAKCGLFVVGINRDLGLLQWKPSASVTDYSSKSTDAFGNTVIVQRAYSKRLSCSLFVENSLADETGRLLAELRATPAVWFGSELYELTLIYGYYKDFSVVIDSFAGSQCSLEIEGLI